MEVAKKVWKDVDLDNTPIFDENVAKYDEWTDDNYGEFRGTRNTSGQRHGIVRRTRDGTNGNVEEACYKNDLLHGLHLEWNCDGTFYAYIYQDNSIIAFITWDKYWSELGS